MARYLMTHSLLNSWIYAIKENPYEDATSERDAYAEFLATLRREPTPVSEAMQKGIDFENMVVAYLKGERKVSHPWFNAVAKVATIVQGSLTQYRARKEIIVQGVRLLLYGKLDFLKAGVIYDTKFSGSYDVGKYIDNTQHPMYFELVPEAKTFTYLVSNGQWVWPETYERDDSPSIIPVISDFFNWLRIQGLMNLYLEKWVAL